MPEVCIKSPNNRRYSLFVCFLIPNKGFSTPDPTAATSQRGLEFRKVVPGVLNTFSPFETAGARQHNTHSENEAWNGVYVYPAWKPNHQYRIMKCPGDMTNMNGSIYTGKFYFNIMPMGKITLRMPNDCHSSRQMEIMFYSS